MTNDEYTCLMIMAEGQNLIRMKDTRWYGALNALEAKGWCKPIGSENFVITEAGRAALGGHEETLDAEIRHTLVKQGELRQHQHAMQARMRDAISAVLAAARIAAMLTGDSEQTAVAKLTAELKARCEQALLQKEIEG